MAIGNSFLSDSFFILRKEEKSIFFPGALTFDDIIHTVIRFNYFIGDTRVKKNSAESRMSKCLHENKLIGNSKKTGRLWDDKAFITVLVVSNAMK